ncbi:4979_t:CDS:1, partial [Ambispora leptoticha]
KTDNEDTVMTDANESSSQIAENFNQNTNTLLKNQTKRKYLKITTAINQQ